MKPKYICEFCSKQFATMSTLKRHKIDHMGLEKQCPFCLVSRKSFIRNYIFQNHLQRCKAKQLYDNLSKIGLI